MDKVDAVVIGAGVVGLAIARALALQGREVIVIEKEYAIGQGVSSRNSEVIHAGVYTPLVHSNPVCACAAIVCFTPTVPSVA
jgi:L-2-hydroxyglutarate oxidase LhgO